MHSTTAMKVQHRVFLCFSTLVEVSQEPHDPAFLLRALELQAPAEEVLNEHFIDVLGKHGTLEGVGRGDLLSRLSARQHMIVHVDRKVHVLGVVHV